LAPKSARSSTTSELRDEAAQLKLAAENLSNRYRPVALFALLALPFAAIGEAAAFYGVANDDHATIITILVSVGILLGGLLLLGPLFIGWLKLLGPTHGSADTQPRSTPE
jgi:small ligand-binding sensory domain FIST